MEIKKKINEWEWPNSDITEYVIPATRRAVKNGGKILIYKDGRFFGKFEILAGNDWFYYNKKRPSGVEGNEIIDYIAKFVNNPKYKVVAKESDAFLEIHLQKENTVEETTGTGASSGSYQTPFQFKENKNMEDKNLVQITEEQFNKMVKNVLLKEFVYSSAAAGATNSNTKNKPTKSTAKASIKAAEANMKPNMEDKRPADIKAVNDQGKQKEEERIEREAGGQQDLEFNSISDKAKENFKKQFTGGDNARSEKNIGNAAGDTTVGKDMLARAKKRKQSKNNAEVPMVSLGSDIELNPDGAVKQNPTMAETYKKYTLKDKSFLTEDFIDEYLAKYRKFYEGKQFFLEDKYGMRAKINWSDKFPIVESVKDIKRVKKWNSLQGQLFNFDETMNGIRSSRLDEHEIFVNMFKKQKQEMRYED